MNLTSLKFNQLVSEKLKLRKNMFIVILSCGFGLLWIHCLQWNLFLFELLEMKTGHSR